MSNTDKNISYNSFVKKSFEDISFAKGLLEEYLPDDKKKYFDLSTLKIANNYFTEEYSPVNGSSDFIYSVDIVDDKKTDLSYIYLLVIHRDIPDDFIPSLRIWKIQLLIWEQYMKRNEKLPIVLPVVFNNSKKHYEAQKILPDCLTKEIPMIDINSIKI